MTKKEQKAQEQRDAVATLLTLIKPNDTIYTDIKHVSSSGMSRQIACYIAYVNDEGQARIREITWLVGQVLDLRLGSQGGLVVSGCGMDMAWSVVYNLGCELWPKGKPEPHGRRNGEPDSNGGYALKKVNL